MSHTPRSCPFEIVQRPGKVQREKVRTPLIEALLNTTDDNKAIRVPNEFKGRLPYQEIRKLGYHLHAQSMPDGIYLWILAGEMELRI